MTVTTTTTYNEYLGNASTLAFSITFRCDDSSWVKVYLDDELSGSGYTVTLNEDQSASPGGTVTFSAAPGSGVAVRLARETPLTQTTLYTAYDSFPAETHERALDKLTLEVQDAEAAAQESLAAEALIRAAADSTETAARIAADAAILAAGTGAVVDLSECPVTSTGSTSRTLADRFADVVNVKDFGAAPGGPSAANVAAFNAAAALAGSLGGGTVFVPAGTYDLGRIGNPDEGVWVKMSGVRFKGAGMGQTIITYTSHVEEVIYGNRPAISWYGGTLPNTGAAVIGSGACEDMTLQDLNTTYNAWTLGALSFHETIQVQVTRVEFKDCKGNGCVYVDSEAGTIEGSRAVIKDCWFNGTIDASVDGEKIGYTSIEGDGYNGNHMDYVEIVGCKFNNLGRFAAEGNFGNHLIIHGNTVKTVPMGFGNIATRTFVGTHNVFVDQHLTRSQWSSEACAFSFSDEGTKGQVVGNAVIANNVFQATRGTFVSWQYDETPANTPAAMLIANNIIGKSATGTEVGRSIISIYSDAPKQLTITGNAYDRGTNGNTISGYAGVIGSTTQVNVHNNIVTQTVASTTGWLVPTQEWLQSPSFRFWDNNVDAQDVGQRVAGYISSAVLAVAAGSKSPVVTCTADAALGGLLVGDTLIALDPYAVADIGGLRLCAWVSATDVISFYYENVSAEPITLPNPHGVIFIQERRRRASDSIVFQM